MLCAEDEQSRTCWMTAFRLLKVRPSLSGAVGRWTNIKKKHVVLTWPSFSCVLLTVWDRTVSELQRPAAEEVQPVAVLCACGEDLTSRSNAPPPPPPPPRLLPLSPKLNPDWSINWLTPNWKPVGSLASLCLRPDQVLRSRRRIIKCRNKILVIAAVRVLLMKVVIWRKLFLSQFSTRGCVGVWVYCHILVNTVYQKLFESDTDFHWDSWLDFSPRGQRWLWPHIFSIFVLLSHGIRQKSGCHFSRREMLPSKLKIFKPFTICLNGIYNQAGHGSQT